MRRYLVALTAAAALTATAASPALANPRSHHWHDHTYAAPAAGAVAGTVFGVGLYNGWWGASTLPTFGSTVAGSAAGGVLVGAGTAALIHAAVTPCQGFHALFGGSGCVNGQYVGR